MVKSESKVASNSKELLSCVKKEILDGSIEAGENTFTVMKRNGTIVPFRKERIFRAIEAAFKNTKKIDKETPISKELSKIADEVTNQVVHELFNLASKNVLLTVEGIQDLVEVTLMKNGQHDVARDYIIYRDQHKEMREDDPRNLKVIRKDSEASVLFLKSLSLQPATGLSFFAVVGAMLYTISGVLRLVRFNVRTHEIKTDKEALSAYKKNFTGLPIPASSAGAISLNLFLHSAFGKDWIPLSYNVKAITLTCFMIFLGYLMISKWKFPSLKTLHFKVPSFHLILFAVLLAIFILYGIFYYLPLVLVICSFSYILLGCVLTLIRRIAGKKSKTLVDFEIDDDKD